jgi:chromosome segregation protein
MRLRASLADVTMVTQAGELIGAEGVIHGGDAGEGNVSVLELQNEVRDLEVEVAGLVQAEEAARQRVTDLDASLSQLQEEVEVCRERIQRHKVELSTLQGQLTLATREVESVQTKIENVQWERGELDNREQAANDSRSGLESELAMARERLEGHEEDQRRLQSQVEGSQRDEAELAEALNELRTSLAVERQAKHAAEAQQQPMEARLSELRELSIRRETEIESFVQRIESAAAENARLAEEVETHQAEAEDLAVEIESRSARRNELLEAIDKAEAELSEARRRYSKAAEQRGREEVAITKIELRLESLVTSILERHQVELAAFEPDAHALLSCIASQKAQQTRGGRQSFVENEGDGGEEGEEDEQPIIVVDASKGTDEVELPPQMTGEPDWLFVEAIVGDLKRRLDGMGPVNVDAIEEYEELEERYNEVRSNYDDLVSSKANLIEVIEKINEETQRRFSETFAQVKINFRDMFKELFGEQGKADLMLQDENDPLESGIEVIAKPPGKKLQSISLLSGGERSMTAVALLFSIYMIKPSPFCVLDELDAPLDESNINRFVKVLDRFIDNSQFIIVTHSKRTMARADVMYGVTMEEFGVSKPVGMRLTNADDMASKGEAKTAAQKAALRLDA